LIGISETSVEATWVGIVRGGGCGIIMASGCASLGICGNTLTPFVCALELHWDSILDAQEKTYNYTLNSSIFKTGY